MTEWVIFMIQQFIFEENDPLLLYVNISNFEIFWFKSFYNYANDATVCSSVLQIVGWKVRKSSIGLHTEPYCGLLTQNYYKVVIVTSKKIYNN